MPQDKPTVPYGYCECGCGQATRLAPQTHRQKGWTKGEPLKYRLGHHHRGRPAYSRSSPVDYVVDENGCWIWQLYRDHAGYGKAHNADGYPVRAHRWMYERHKGPIPEGLYMDHLCRVPACVNPDHLEPVTPAENTRRGNSTRLTLEVAREIRHSDASGIYLAKRYGISEQHVSGIRKGRSWKDAA